VIKNWQTPEEARVILCCGEALIDFVPLEVAQGYRPCPGGSIFNIAVGLGRLGTPVGFYSSLSTDFFGDLLVNYLVENGVSTDFILRASGPTTLAFVSLPDGRHTEPRYVFYANGAVDRSLQQADLPSDLPEKVQALHFGSISLVLEPGASTLEALMRRESGRRILSLDPNIRPSLIPDREAYRRRFESWLRLVDIVRLSLADLEWLYPGAEPDPLIQGWLDWGPSLCLLTLGGDGASGVTVSGARASVPTPKITVADTVGAGDTFLAATLSWLHENRRLADRQALRALSQAELGACLAYAARAAAINCSRPGANPPYKHEMQRDL
jgi:fructokinase